MENQKDLKGHQSVFVVKKRDADGKACTSTKNNVQPAAHHPSTFMDPPSEGTPCGPPY